MTTSNFIALFSINTGLGIPIYQQLIDQIKQAIRMKLLSPGDQLPSVRTLASSLKINPMTISKAFAQLEVEGVLERKRGVGMLVAQQATGAVIEQSIEEPLLEFIAKARNSNLDDQTIITLVQQYLSLQRKDMT